MSRLFFVLCFGAFLLNFGSTAYDATQNRISITVFKTLAGNYATLNTGSNHNRNANANVIGGISGADSVAKQSATNWRRAEDLHAIGRFYCGSATTANSPVYLIYTGRNDIPNVDSLLVHNFGTTDTIFEVPRAVWDSSAAHMQSLKTNLQAQIDRVPSVVGSTAVVCVRLQCAFAASASLANSAQAAEGPPRVITSAHPNSGNHDIPYKVALVGSFYACNKDANGGLTQALTAITIPDYTPSYRNLLATAARDTHFPLVMYGCYKLPTQLSFKKSVGDSTDATWDSIMINPCSSAATGFTGFGTHTTGVTGNLIWPRPSS